MPVKLLIFDIDGTLTNTRAVDDASFINAFTHLFQKEPADTCWENFTDVTDAGLFAGLYQAAFNRQPEEAEKIRFQNQFFSNLEAALAASPAQFMAVDGAPEFMRYCFESEQYAIAFATGGWARSAALKLRAAGIMHQNIPLSCCDGFIGRKNIVCHALEMARRHYHISAFDAVIYFGDGVWDYKTTLELNMPFIGVDINRDEKLNRLGVRHILHNFTNTNTVLHTINQCCL